jgi:hypothetical protein
MYVAKQESNMDRGFQKSIKVAKSLFLSFLVFVLCWAPYGLIILLDYGDQLPREVYMYSTQLGYSYSAMNSFFYYMFNPSFKKGYAHLAQKILPKKFVEKRSRNTASLNTASESYTMTKRVKSAQANLKF